MLPFAPFEFTTVNQIVDIVLAGVLIFAVIFLCVRLRFHRITVFALIFLLGLIIAAFFLQLSLALNILVIFVTAFLFILCLSHTGAIRTMFSKRFRIDLGRKTSPDKIVDRQALYDEVGKAVTACSKQKIGALITFERHDNLQSITKNGTRINAPVTSELLTTIFYPGTRLHDGAVIIKDNMLYAASVYYTPTTKALTGKYGSRHRAAIGISEISDSVTVVVSEETGRISIAQSGEIEPVNLDEFVKVLTERMNLGE